MGLICSLLGIFKTVFPMIFGFCICDYLPIVHQLIPCK